MKALIGKKVGMTHIFDDRGNVVPVTALEVGPCTVVQVKNTKTDGYEAVQLGFGLDKNINKPKAGHVKDSGSVPKVLREFDLNTEVELVEGEEVKSYKIGDKLTCEVFAVGDMVAVTGTSKGKGFAGTVKRHNFATGPKTHGSHNYRAPGSIGAGFPQHVMKGMKMAGHMGAEQVTVKNLKIVKIDPVNNIIAVRGAVPGPKKSVVLVKG
jgi:large subunit ribosomal protein L3